MADSIYGIQEFRCAMRADACDIYILIGNANDFMPIAGWYKKTIPAPDGKAYAEDGLHAISRALMTQEFLGLGNAGWSRDAPTEETRVLQDEVVELREAVMRAHMRSAELMRSVHDDNVILREAANRALEEGIEAGLSLEAERIARLRGASVMIGRDQQGRVSIVELHGPNTEVVATLWDEERDHG